MILRKSPFSYIIIESTALDVSLPFRRHFMIIERIIALKHVIVILLYEPVTCNAIDSNYKLYW